MLFGRSKWKRGRLSEFSLKEGLIYGNWFCNPIRTLVNTVFVCRPSDSTVSEDAGIEPRTVATLALAVIADSLTPRLDLIHYKYHTGTVALPPQP
jgi:hypothetical protein